MTLKFKAEYLVVKSALKYYRLRLPEQIENLHLTLPCNINEIQDSIEFAVEIGPIRSAYIQVKILEYGEDYLGDEIEFKVMRTSTNIVTIIKEPIIAVIFGSILLLSIILITSCCILRQRRKSKTAKSEVSTALTHHHPLLHHTGTSWNARNEFNFQQGPKTENSNGNTSGITDSGHDTTSTTKSYQALQGLIPPGPIKPLTVVTEKQGLLQNNFVPMPEIPKPPEIPVREGSRKLQADVFPMLMQKNLVLCSPPLSVVDKACVDAQRMSIAESSKSSRPNVRMGTRRSNY